MPVTPETLLAFMAASMVLLVIPGPTILLVIGQALAHGRGAALASVTGVALGDLLAASLSIAGVGAMRAASATAFTLAKVAGAAWLVWLGIGMWRARPVLPSADLAPAPKARLFRDAFVVTALNPKGILFFMAFVPKFIDPGRAFAPQAGGFVAIFVVLGALNAWAYALLATRARRAIRRPAVLRAATRTGGGLLVAAGLAALLTRRAT